MRADRLVAIVLLLQTHGRMTVTQIAERLESSERTVRRDLDALLVAGVPLYAQRGRGGGWTLLGGHRIDLSGLKVGEAQALLLATDSGMATLGPGFAEELKAARRKLVAALPEPLREHVGTAAGSLLIDDTHWGPGTPLESDPHPLPGGPGDPLHLEALRRAVGTGRQIDMFYEPPRRLPEARRVHPHGLICKRGTWYLVATAPAGLRTYRVSRVRSVQITAEPVVHPEHFDLAEAWTEIQQTFSAQVPTSVVVKAEVAPRAMRRLRSVVGTRWPLVESERTPVGRVQVQLRFPSVPLATAELLSFANDLEVVAPAEVRAELASIGARLAERYGTSPSMSTVG